MGYMRRFMPMAVLFAVLVLAGTVVLKRGAAACPMQEELKLILSKEAASIRQWNAFKEIYSFEVTGSQKKIGGYVISFNPGYVNCVKDDGAANFKCDRRDPIFEISQDKQDGVLQAHEVTIDRKNLGVVGEIMCTLTGRTPV